MSNTAIMSEPQSDLKRTPLYNAHLKRGAKMVPFAGWEMPVQYVGVIPEHQQVRQSVGLFDVSHMGEVFVEGADAEAVLNQLTSNDVRKLADGQAQYSALPNMKGGAVDDIIVYRFSSTRYLVCVNASNSDRDFEWMTKHNPGKASITNRSAEFAQIAVQGPNGVALTCRLPGCADLEKLGSFHFAEVQCNGVPMIAARTGYTGEDGFELFVPAACAELIWDQLLTLGADLGAQPIGLGARDSLRLEACLPLHGNELGDDITLIEAGLGWIVSLDKGDFSGREILSTHKQQGAPRSLIGFIIESPGIARHGDAVFSSSGESIGVVTSGTKTPTVQKALGMALVDSRFQAPGEKIAIEVRGKRLEARVVKKPFYRRGKGVLV